MVGRRVAHPARLSSGPDRRAVTSMLGCLALLPLARATSAATPIRFSYQRSSTLLTLLKANGTLEPRFAEKGFAVSWHLFDNVINAMNSGAVDFDADVGDAVPIFTQAAGSPLTYYAREDGSPAAEAIIVPAASTVRTMQDLKGKTVAVLRGSGCHFVLVAALARAGLSIRDIRPAYLSPSDAAAAFEKGRLDAWSIWDPFLALTEAKVATRTICDASGISSYQRYYSASNALVDAHPDLVEIVFDALVDTGRWVKRHPDEAARRLSPLWGGMSDSVIKVVNGRRSYSVRPVDKALLGEEQRIADAFYAARLIPKPVVATDLRLWQPRKPPK